MLVPLIGPLPTTTCELAGATSAGALDEGVTLLCEDVTNERDAEEEGGAMLELGTADDEGVEGASAGVGVK